MEDLTPKITLLTPTGDRPEAFALCEKYMQRQTFKGPIQWIIVDDCMPETKLTVPSTSNIKQEYYRGPKDWRPNINTQRLNMDEALKHIAPDSQYIFVIEDDDWYHPRYIEDFLYLLRKYPVVGEGCAKYYNILERSFREWNNLGHASLCQTGLRSDHLEILDEAVHSGEIFMDISFWRKAREHHVESVLFIGLERGVGIKGMPGRFGIGAGHKPDGFKKDPGLTVLNAWVGGDYKVYEEIAKNLAFKLSKK